MSENAIEELINRIFKSLDNSKDQEEHDFLVKEFFNYCLKQADVEKDKGTGESLDFMCVVSVLLPKIVNESYTNSVVNLMDQLTYKSLPYKKKNFISTRKHL